MFDDFTEEELAAAADGYTQRVRALLQTRMRQLEEQRHAINDHYSNSDLFLRQFEVDFEENLIDNLDCCLTRCAEDCKDTLRRNAPQEG